MLLIPTYVAPSAIDGLGLYAAAPIASGTIWWRFDPMVDRIFHASEIEELPEIVKAHVLRSGFVQDGRYFMCGDDARFVNHSFDSPSVPTEGMVGSVLVRDIGEGDEITEDYTQFDQNTRPFMARDAVGGQKDGR